MDVMFILDRSATQFDYMKEKKNIYIKIKFFDKLKLQYKKQCLMIVFDRSATQFDRTE